MDVKEDKTICVICKSRITGAMNPNSHFGGWMHVSDTHPECHERNNKAVARIRKWKEEKKLDSYPDKMDASDFDRLIEQACMLYLKQDNFRQWMKDNDANPLMFFYDQMALQIKEVLITKFLKTNPELVSANTGASRWHSAGTYCFKKDTIPKALVLTALKHMGMPMPVVEVTCHDIVWEGKNGN